MQMHWAVCCGERGGLGSLAGRLSLLLALRALALLFLLGAGLGATAQATSSGGAGLLRSLPTGAGIEVPLGLRPLRPEGRCLLAGDALLQGVAEDAGSVPLARDLRAGRTEAKVLLGTRSRDGGHLVPGDIHLTHARIRMVHGHDAGHQARLVVLTSELEVLLGVQDGVHEVEDSIPVLAQVTLDHLHRDENGHGLPVAHHLAAVVRFRVDLLGEAQGLRPVEHHGLAAANILEDLSQLHHGLTAIVPWRTDEPVLDGAQHHRVQHVLLVRRNAPAGDPAGRPLNRRLAVRSLVGTPGLAMGLAEATTHEAGGHLSLHNERFTEL
jgi:hypothetical protein